jgi:hypothetical protein
MIRKISKEPDWFSKINIEAGKKGLFDFSSGMDKKAQHIPFIDGEQPFNNELLQRLKNLKDYFSETQYAQIASLIHADEKTDAIEKYLDLIEHEQMQDQEYAQMELPYEEEEYDPDNLEEQEEQDLYSYMEWKIKNR